MWLPLLLLSQSTAAAPEQPRTVIDLLPESCAESPDDSDEIVVCGRRAGDSPYRIRSGPPVPPALPEAKINIGGATLAAETEQGEVGGIPSNRAMIKLRIKF